MTDAPTPAPRLKSLDALRGFDMFWIIGGDAIISEVAKLWPSAPMQAVAAQFSEHVEWEGFRFYDAIFPLFLFIIGAALPFSIGRRLEAGDSKPQIIGKILLRTALLFLAGLIYNGLLKLPGWEHMRLFGVLQRQALGFGIAAILMVTTKPRTQAITGAALLIGYWIVMKSVPVPGHPLGSMSPQGNLANFVDRLTLLPGQMYESFGDPEGLLSTIPAVCTALMGVFAGNILRSARPDPEKLKILVASGVGAILLGIAWMPFFPIIKKIWTSSYTLAAGGLSLLLLALFFYVIDVRKASRWALPLIVIGMNPLTIYFLVEIVDFQRAAGFFLEGICKLSPTGGPLILLLGAMALKLTVLGLMYQKKVFWRL